jgi:adenylate kinase family enzyme
MLSIMPMPSTPQRIHVFGASGAGTTTLGRAVAARLGLPFHDTDDYFWEPTDPPYQRIRERELRRRLLIEALVPPPEGGWVLAGSVCGWGDDAAKWFDLAVFILVPTDLRLARLREREAGRFGPRLAPGGDMHKEHGEFMAWAARYDDGPPDMRSRKMHEQWITALTCPVLRVDGARPVEELCGEVVEALGDAKA